MWRGGFVWTVGLAVATVGVQLATRDAVLRESAWILLVAGALALVLIGMRRHRPDRDLPWRLLAAAFALLLVDNLVLFPLWETTPAHRLVSDIAQLLAFPCLALVTLGMVRRQIPQGDRDGAIDACTIMVALFSALAGLVFAPNAAGSTSLLGGVVFLVAPLLLAAVTAAGLRLALAGGHRVPSMWLLVASSVSALTGHVLRTLAQVAGTYERGQWEDVFVALAYVTAGLAALHPSMRVMTLPAAPSTSTERRLTQGRLAILSISLMTPPVTLLLQGEDHTPVVPLVACIVGTGLVIWRLWRLVAEREMVREEMRHIAIHDALTGLPNRVALFDGLDAALARGARTRTTTSVLFVDLDGFKAINDSGGHATGDAVLIEMAARLRSSGRTGDLLARLAGDEFVLVCEDTPLAAAVVLAERSVAAMQEPVVVNGRTFALTASVGVATSALVPGDSNDLLSAADTAMYVAKRDGGSAVRWHDGFDSLDDAGIGASTGA